MCTSKDKWPANSKIYIDINSIYYNFEMTHIGCILAGWTEVCTSKDKWSVLLWSALLKKVRMGPYFFLTVNESSYNIELIYCGMHY